MLPEHNPTLELPPAPKSELFPFPKVAVLKRAGINWAQFSAGAAFLVAGSLEYFFSRPPDSAFFLIPIRGLAAELHGRFDPFGALGFLAPDFFHPLAFALMCMALLPDTVKNRVAICLAWFILDAALELAQKYGTGLTGFAARWSENIPALKHLTGCLAGGTFDVYDLLAIAGGALTALVIGQFTRGGKNEARAS